MRMDTNQSDTSLNFKGIELGNCHDIRLESLEIGITSQCNFRCEYCCAHDKNNKTILTADKVIEIISELTTLKRIKLSGGEVLIYFDECIKIIEYCSTNGIETQVNTNGSLLTKDKIDRLVNAGINYIHISLNYTNAADFSNYYKVPENVFHTIIQAIKYCANNAYIDTIVETIIFANTENTISDIHKFIAGMGVRKHEIQLGIPISHNNWKHITARENIVDKIKKLIDEKYERTELYFSCIASNFPQNSLVDIKTYVNRKKGIYFPKCIEGRSQLHLHCNGDILICELGYPVVINNIFTQKSLNELICDPPLILRKFVECHICDKANYYYDKDSGESNDKLNSIKLSINKENIENSTIISMLKHNALVHPESKALAMGEYSLTFSEFNQISDKIANFLNEEISQNNKVIGILADRSIELILSIYGVIKTGNAYLPIDANYPIDRIEYILDSSGCDILMIQDKYLAVTEKLPVKVVTINKLLILPETITDIKYRYDLERPFYLLYTSGTTGKPKGAIIRENSFNNLMNWYINDLGISSKDNVLLISPHSFDLTQKNIYLTFICGGTLHLFQNGFYNYRVMSELIDQNNITIINCAPSAFYTLIDLNIDDDFMKLKKLRYVILGGESITTNRIKPWVESDNFSSIIINSYGPTECTDVVSYYIIDPEEIKNNETIPIGKPLSNIKIYILDDNMEPVNDNEPGEIFIGGICVGNGYRNSKELTRMKFVEYPRNSGEVTYKTGDIGRIDSQGNIVFLGRVDNQVKINGVRIELEEIESNIIECVGVKDACVVVKKNKMGDNILIAYVVCADDISVDSLKKHLKGKVNDQMVPSYIKTIDALPLNVNGKIDKNKLASMH